MCIRRKKVRGIYYERLYEEYKETGKNSTSKNNLKAIHKDKTPMITKAKSKVDVQTRQTTMDAFLMK